MREHGDDTPRGPAEVVQPPSPDGVAAPITIDDFGNVDIRVGTVIAAERHAAARRPALILTIDFGAAIGIRRSSAQVTENHPPETLIGRQVAAVVNLPPRQIGPMMSQVLTLGFPDAGGKVVLIGPLAAVPDGGRLF